MNKNLTDPQPFYDCIRGLEVYKELRAWIADALHNSCVLCIIGPADFMDAPLEFQSGMLMEFCRKNGHSISIVAACEADEPRVADNGNEAFAYENQFIALRDCLTETFLLMEQQLIESDKPSPSRP